MFERVTHIHANPLNTSIECTKRFLPFRIRTKQHVLIVIPAKCSVFFFFNAQYFHPPPHYNYMPPLPHADFVIETIQFTYVKVYGFHLKFCPLSVLNARSAYTIHSIENSDFKNFLLECRMDIAQFIASIISRTIKLPYMKITQIKRTGNNPQCTYNAHLT